jgi:hypothetical protein
MRSSYCLALILMLSGCGVASGDQPVSQTTSDSLLPNVRCEMSAASGGCGIWGPSLVELIARPELYNGKRVRVIGFVNFEFEGNGLYISKEDWQQSIARNGLWIDPPSGFEADSGPSKRQPNQRYVLVEGTFNARHLGHMGMWSGAIEHVTRLEQWPPR